MQLELCDLADVISEAIRSEVEPLRAQLAATEQRAAIEISALKSELAFLKSAVPDSFRLRAIVVDMAAEEVAKITPAHDGVSIDPAVVDVMVAAQVEKAVAALPKPQDGRSISVEDVQPFILSEIQKAVSAIPVPKEAVSLVGAFIDREGHLIVTVSDGSTKDVGEVVGRPGKDIEIESVFRFVQKELDSWPRPLDGKEGSPGRDGTLDNLKIEYDGARAVKFCFKDGSPIEGGELRLPIVLDRGVYKSGDVYEQGDAVSWGGDFYIALRDTKATPGTEKDSTNRAWRLAVRRGAEGKPGKIGEQGPRGEKGEQGPRGPSGY